MREALIEPPIDPDIASEAKARALELYRLHEAGEPYDAELAEFARLCGTTLSTSDLSGAFGSIDAESFAMGLVLEPVECPRDLSREELVELLDAIRQAEGEEWQTPYWLRVLEENTGSNSIVELLYYPKRILGPEDGRGDLTSEQILDEAYKRPVRVLVTPPPEEGSV